MIRHKFVTEYGYSDAVPIAEFITDDLMEVINSVSVPYERLQPGQMVWLGVPVDLPRNEIGKPLRNVSLKPIILTILTEEDVLDLMAAEGREGYRALRRKRVARLFREAKAQGAILPYSDLAALLGVSTATIRRDVQEWEAEHGEKLPHRGRVHDIGPTTTHKAAIVESILQGKQLPRVAREHNHALENVERYYQGYNAVEVACGYCDDMDQIALMTGLKRHVVEQYYQLVEMYHPEKMLKYNKRDFTDQS
jgi:hypothetical protein